MDDVAGTLHANAPLRHGGTGSSSAAPYGFVQYEIRGFWELEEFESMHQVDGTDDAEDKILFLERLLEKPLRSGGSLKDAPSHVIDHARFLLPNMKFTVLSDVRCAELPFVFYSVAIGKRTSPGVLLSRLPPPSAITRWRADLGVRRSTAAAGSRDDRQPGPPTYDSIVLEMPPPKRRRTGGGAPGGNPNVPGMVDPLLMIRSLCFSTMLRQQAYFKEGIKAAKAVHAGDDSGDEGEDDAKCVDESSLLRGHARVDVTAMLLHRREWHADVVHDNIEAVTLNTDSSPNTGLEFQGMVAEVYRRDGTHYEQVMPGATMAYGLQDMMAKSMCLLWAIFFDLRSIPGRCGALLFEYRRHYH